MRCISIGIDIGSTIIKVVAWDEKSGMVYSDYVCHHQEVQKPSVIDPEHRFLSKCRGGGNIFCMNWRCWILILRHTAFQSYPICAWEPVKKQRGLPLLRLPVWVGSFRLQADTVIDRICIWILSYQARYKHGWISVFAGRDWPQWIGSALVLFPSGREMAALGPVVKAVRSILLLDDPCLYRWYGLSCSARACTISFRYLGGSGEGKKKPAVHLVPSPHPYLGMIIGGA